MYTNFTRNLLSLFTYLFLSTITATDMDWLTKHSFFLLHIRRGKRKIIRNFAHKIFTSHSDAKTIAKAPEWKNGAANYQWWDWHCGKIPPANWCPPWKAVGAGRSFRPRRRCPLEEASWRGDPLPALVAEISAPKGRYSPDGRGRRERCGGRLRPPPLRPSWGRHGLCGPGSSGRCGTTAPVYSRDIIKVYMQKNNHLQNF